jgi:hypothetical protein
MLHSNGGSHDLSQGQSNCLKNVGATEPYLFRCRQPIKSRGW